MAPATLPASTTPWEYYVEDHDRIPDTMSKVFDGFEDFNSRVRLPLGFRIRQPARERVFVTASGYAEFSDAPMPDVVPPPGRLTLATARSHDQWNTTIYSDDDRYRGPKNLRTALFMNVDDMRERGLDEFDLIDITSFARGGSTRSVYGYMPELYVLCAIADQSAQRNQPLTKHFVVEVTPTRGG
jgi:anaerobic selenocysteine-containing dehydrogenase